MKKKIISYISLIMIITSVVLTIIFGRMMQESEIISEKEMMKTIVSQMYENIISNDEMTQQAKKLFVADYLNRAKFASFLIDEDRDGVFTDDEWEEMLSVLEVSGVNIIDENGVIVQSSDAQCIGINFYEIDSLKSFIPLIEGKEKDGYYIEFDGKSITDNKERVYLGISKSDHSKGMIQIEISPDILRQYEEMSSIKNYILSIPTKESRTLFLADEHGEIVGITRNNSQEMKMDHIVETLKTAIDHPIIVEINGEMQLLLTKEYQGYFIGYSSRISEIERIGNSYIVKFALLLGALTVLTIITFYYLFNRLVLKDIDMIRQKAYMFVNGHSEICFDEGKTKELDQLSTELNKVIRVINLKGERISTIASMMGDDFAAYEYYANLKQVYYSSNLPQMLGLSHDECKKEIINYFERKYPDIHNNEIFEEEEIITLNSGRTIKIKRTITGHSSYAFLEDITDEKEKEEQLIQNLQKEKEKNYIDFLTGIYNRQKIKEYIDVYINEHEHSKGIILLLDLDNFKTVNDQKGHLEGDKLLKKFADILCQQFRDGDVKARLGGDEFMVFVPDYIPQLILEKKIESLLDTMRQELSDYYKQFQLSVSIGAVYLEGNYQSFEELYKSVDAAMYVAKGIGKDNYYINKEHNTCMQENCLYCRAKCERRKILFEEKTIDKEKT